MNKKVDLKMLNRLVDALTAQLALAEAIDAQTLPEDHLIELSKAMGITTAISTEAMALVGDIARSAAPMQSNNPADMLGNLFGPKKKSSLQ